jgi:hypothetical protein
MSKIGDNWLVGAVISGAQGVRLVVGYQTEWEE